MKLKAAYWVLAVLLGTAYLIALLEHDYTVMADQQDAEALSSREFAARQACGENGSWRWINDKELQCYTHQGNRTGGRVVADGGAR